MVTNRTVIGAHVRLFPDGLANTLPTVSTASRTVLPGPTDPAWQDAGVSDWDIASTSKTEDFMAPSPGARVLFDVVTVSHGAKLKGKLMQLQNLVYQMLLGAYAAGGAGLPLSPTAGGAYVPLSGEAVIRTWLELKQYNQANVLLNTLTVFVAMKIPSDVKFDDKPVDVQVECDVLYSTLNAGTLT